VVLASPPHSSAAAPAPSCFPAHAKTLAATKTARVFRTRRGTYGCLYKHGRARRLDPDLERRDIVVTVTKRFRFAGPYLAYPRLVSQGCGPSTCDWTEVVVADLRPAKPLIFHKHYAASDETLARFREPVDEGANAEAFVTDLALLRTGVVAWIACEGYTRGPCDTEKDADYDPTLLTSVFAATPTRRARTKLDEGRAIDKASLTYAGGKFHWRKDGAPRSATVQ
jgi:hypothetical protein